MVQVTGMRVLCRVNGSGHEDAAVVHASTWCTPWHHDVSAGGCCMPVSFTLSTCNNKYTAYRCTFCCFKGFALKNRHAAQKSLIADTMGCWPPQQHPCPCSLPFTFEFSHHRKTPTRCTPCTPSKPLPVHCLIYPPAGSGQRQKRTLPQSG